MQDQDFHLKKTTRFAWCTRTSLLLLHGRPVAEPNGKIRHFHIFHNAPYPHPPPQKKMNKLLFFISPGYYSRSKRNLCKLFFWKGCGGGGGAKKVHFGKCLSVESEKTLGTGLAYMLVLRWKKAKWRMDHPEWIAWTYTLILFNQYKKRLGSLQSLGLTGLCQTRIQSLFMCFGGERRLGVRLRRAREFFLLPFPWDPARTSTWFPIFSHPKKHLHSDWVRVWICAIYATTHTFGYRYQAYKYIYNPYWSHFDWSMINYKILFKE